MNETRDRDGARTDRRVFLRRLAGATTLAAAGLSARAAFAEDAALDALIGEAQRGSFGQHFDEASRTIHMPKASEPTVSTATAQTTDQAVERYAAIVNRGGWPQIPSSQRAAGRRSPSERDAAARAPRRFRRHRSERGRQRCVRFLRRGRGAALSGPPWHHRRRRHSRRDAGRAQRAGAGAAGAAQGQRHAAPRARRRSRPALRAGEYPRRAHRGDRKRRRRIAAHRRGRQAGSAVAGDQQQDRSDQFQSVLDGPAFDRAEGSDPENAGSAGLSHQEPHPHFRRPPAGAASRRRSIGTRKTRRTTRSSRIPAAPIRWARSASISRALSASTCTTRR